MGKISNKVSKGLGAAIEEAKAKMTGSVVTNINDPEDIENVSTGEVEQLLNSGAEAQKKRKRRTKAEIEAAKLAEGKEENSLFQSLEVPKEKPESRMRTHEEVCEDDLRKALERGYPEPEFDFRNYYEKGQIIYYIHILKGLIQTKELKKLKVRTLYPRMMVCDEEKSCCQCIGYDTKDMIFLTPRDADAVYKTINMKVEEDANSPKSRRKASEGTDEGVDEETGEYEPLKASEEDEDEEN